MKLTKKEKDELCKRIDIAISTFYKWEKTKPELINLLLLGLKKEKDIENNIDELSTLDNVVSQLLPKFKELEEKVKRLEEEKK